MTARQYQLSAAARLDLLKIWNYLAESASLDIADKVLAEIEEAINELIKSPGHGHRRADLTDRDLLFYRVHSYLVIYRPDAEPLHVVRVLHGARDAKSLLRE